MNKNIIPVNYDNSKTHRDHWYAYKPHWKRDGYNVICIVDTVLKKVKKLSSKLPTSQKQNIKSGIVCRLTGKYTDEIYYVVEPYIQDNYVPPIKPAKKPTPDIKEKEDNAQKMTYNLVEKKSRQNIFMIGDLTASELIKYIMDRKVVFYVQAGIVYNVIKEYLDSYKGILDCQVQIYPAPKLTIKLFKNDPDIIHIVTRFVYEDLFEELALAGYKNVFFLNIEQYTRIPQMKEHAIKCFNLNLIDGIIDYSEENIHIIKEATDEKYHNKILHFPYQVNKDEIETKNKNIRDRIVMVSPNSNYRKKIYNIVNHRKKPIMIAKGWAKKDRDWPLFYSKILLNVHFAPSYTITEQIRIYRCIFNTMLIVSEGSTHQEKVFLKDYIIFDEYDNLVDKSIEVLDNYNEYYKKIYGNFDLEKIKKDLYDAFVTQSTI